MTGVYLEPVGLLYGAVAQEAIAGGVALPLAGGPIAFCAARLWEGEPGRITHATVRTATLAAIGDSRIKDLVERLTAPRTAISGLAMNKPHIMGIVNVTPDSFSDGGEHAGPEAARRHGELLVSQGASILDIGGESTRPGAETISVADEISRVIPVIERLATAGVPLSIDTRKPEVMRAAARAGAAILNDVSGLTFSPNSAATAAELQKPTVIMHAKGDPKTMQDNPAYADVVVEVYDFLESRMKAAVSAGLAETTIVADPGIGFGKTLDHNLSLLGSLGIFHGLGVPLLLGASRKGLISDVAGMATPKDRVPGSIAAALLAIARGVQIVRVHDVFATRQAISVWQSSHFGQAGAGKM